MAYDLHSVSERFRNNAMRRLTTCAWPCNDDRNVACRPAHAPFHARLRWTARIDTGLSHTTVFSANHSSRYVTRDEIEPYDNSQYSLLRYNPWRTIIFQGQSWRNPENSHYENRKQDFQIKYDRIFYIIP